MRRSQTNALLGKVIQDQILLSELLAQNASLSIELAQGVNDLAIVINPETKVDGVAYEEIREKLKKIVDRLQAIQITAIPN